MKQGDSPSVSKSVVILSVAKYIINETRNLSVVSTYKEENNMNPVELKYNKSHEWAKVEGNTVTIGITEHAQDSLGDVVFVELPDNDATLEAGQAFGTVESVKAVSDIITPVSGKVIEYNQEVLDSPELLNNDPYGEGWLIKIEADDLKELDKLMSAAEYEAFVAEEG